MNIFKSISNTEFSLIKISNKGGLLKNIKNAGLYFSASILQTLLALIAQPIYSIHLEADEFGIIGYFNALQNFFSPLFIFGMTTYYLMKYFKQNEEENKRLLFNLTFYLCSLNTLFIFISYVLIYYYFKKLNVTIPLNPFVWYVLAILFLNNFKSVVLINYRIRKKAFSFFGFSAINALLNVGLGLFFVAVLQMGANGRMLAPVISMLIMLPFCIYILRKYTKIDFDFRIFKRAVKEIYPFVLAAYAYIPINNIDRVYLERLDNLSELGLYNIGITIAGYMNVAYTALALAFEPDLFKSIVERNYKKLLRIALVIFVPYLFFLLVFFQFSEVVINILTSGRYVAAKLYTNIAMFSVFLMGIFAFVAKIYVALNKTKLTLIVNIIGGTTAIIIMYFAVSKFSFIGAAYGKVIIASITVLSSIIIAIYQLKRQKIIV